ncbi:alpha/beta fold hydrolase [Myceligenerans pegani]|uniref:Alpha/beta fold hydrolase n=1 Tax=Myceligenerans pegani TaxID=2776917 RepID=A0ABR9N0R9_9MICO|nr:alpha/beta fold hydrolase [Myceligenerans sp. TRM 65318]MBE1876831.1 alpha/beta fold hydrolase [Myceligenerans sp. TRM 65318]MBE3019102.1 alpha/beta fold hydrolase [Myceligenerans sp. TRM 65318]
MPTLRHLAHLPAPLAAEVAAWAAFRLGPRAAVRPHERELHETARRVTLGHRRPAANRGRPVDVAVYTWGGPGAPAVLLVHGWQSRAAFFAPLIADLVGAGRRVVAYDAPGHGDSGGTRRTLADDVAIIHRLSAAEAEGWEGVVGHSAGVLAAGVALADGAPARRFAGLAGISSAHAINDGFFEFTGTPRRLRERYDDVVRRRRFPDEPDLYERYDLTRRPVPATIPALFVHDAADRRVPHRQSELLLGAHAGSAELVTTTGLGHNRIVRDGAVRRRTVEHVTAARTSGAETATEAAETAWTVNAGNLP